MKIYSQYGFTNFIVTLGYKGQIIKNYLKSKNYGWKIQFVDTGVNTMTGGRIKRLKYLAYFYLRINLKKYIKF